MNVYKEIPRIDGWYWFHGTFTDTDGYQNFIDEFCDLFYVNQDIRDSASYYEGEWRGPLSLENPFDCGTYSKSYTIPVYGAAI